MDVSEADNTEILEQKITLALQQIDDNFVKAHETASHVLHEVKQYVQHVGEINTASKVWVDFFESFPLAKAEPTISEPPPVSSTPVGATTMYMTGGTPSPIPTTPSFGSPPKTVDIVRVPGFSSKKRDPARPSYLPSAEPESAITPNPMDRDSVAARLSFAPRESVVPSPPAISPGPQTPDFPSPPVTTPYLRPGEVSEKRISRTSVLAPAQTPEAPIEESVVIEETIQDDFPMAEYEDDEEPPEFDLSLFPSMYRAGRGALEITELYAQFFSGGDTSGKSDTLSLVQLKQLMPAYDEERLLLMLDLLASRRLLKPLFYSGQMYWQRWEDGTAMVVAGRSEGEGAPDVHLAGLTMALPPLNSIEQIATTLFPGSGASPESEAMGKRLARKLGSVVYLSCTIPSMQCGFTLLTPSVTDTTSWGWIERKLLECK